MLIAMVFSFLFTFIFGTLAAKNKHAERIIIPAIDILQSVPVLGFLSITVASFIALFPGSMWGPQCACIFAIFTAQAWNMALGFYQSLKNVPDDLIEASKMFHLSKWQHFWRIEVPLAMPSLLWNTMMSMSASWVFLVASEAISVANQNIHLPGIGSYIALAIANKNTHAICYAILATFVVIILYDQILFRPMMKWSDQFRFEQEVSDKENRSWFTFILQRMYLIYYFGISLAWLQDLLLNKNLFSRANIVTKHKKNQHRRLNKGILAIWYLVVATAIATSLFMLNKFIFSTLSLVDAWQAIKLGFATLLRVFATIIISSLIWIPLGVWIGLKPKLARTTQPIIQFLAAFPANLLFPFITWFIMRYELNIQIWLTSLMIIGSMWYIAFNVIAGTITLPKDYHLATDNLGVTGWLWWKRFILPGIFPYFITGAITATGAAWNLSIVAEFVQWGNKTIMAYGLGAYVTEFTKSGNFHRIALGIAVMCLYVLILNRIIWQPLYKLAEKRFGC
jgi:NitT/TauT family transport system permease protein